MIKTAITPVVCGAGVAAAASCFFPNHFGKLGVRKIAFGAAMPTYVALSGYGLTKMGLGRNCPTWLKLAAVAIYVITPLSLCSKRGRDFLDKEVQKTYTAEQDMAGFFLQGASYISCYLFSVL